MVTFRPAVGRTVAFAACVTWLAGCNGEDAAPKGAARDALKKAAPSAPDKQSASADAKDGVAPEQQAKLTPDKRGAAKSAPKRVELGQQKNVVLEIDGEARRVLVKGYVCLREGQLEQFLTRKGTKEHEAVVAADVDARDIHTALMLAGAEPGSPVKFQPEYQPARGTVVNVLVEYQDKGKTVRRPAQEWVRSIQTKKDLGISWVFAGSMLLKDPNDPTRKPSYAANGGDVICLSNFETALLDLPIMSTMANADLFFEAHTERIPRLETPVTVILEPVITPKPADEGKRRGE